MDTSDDHTRVDGLTSAVSITISNMNIDHNLADGPPYSEYRDHADSPSYASSDTGDVPNQVGDLSSTVSFYLLSLLDRDITKLKLTPVAIQVGQAALQKVMESIKVADRDADASKQGTWLKAVTGYTKLSTRILQAGTSIPAPATIKCTSILTGMTTAGTLEVSLTTLLKAFIRPNAPLNVAERLKTCIRVLLTKFGDRAIAALAVAAVKAGVKKHHDSPDLAEWLMQVKLKEQRAPLSSPLSTLTHGSRE
jgi:hypothetical protein